jgi:hypothetical protein
VGECSKIDDEESDPVAKLTLALDAPEGPLTAWVVEALGPDGKVLARAGDPEIDTRVKVKQGVMTFRPPPLARWITAGAALACGVAATALQVSSAQRVELSNSPEVWVDEGKVEHDRAVAEAKWATGLFAGAGVMTATSLVLFAW